MGHGSRHRRREDLSKAGFELYYFWVVPHVKPEDRGKYAAVDVDSPHHEIDADPDVAKAV